MVSHSLCFPRDTLEGGLGWLGHFLHAHHSPVSKLHLPCWRPLTAPTQSLRGDSPGPSNSGHRMMALLPCINSSLQLAKLQSRLGWELRPLGLSKSGKCHTGPAPGLRSSSVHMILQANNRDLAFQIESAILTLSPGLWPTGPAQLGFGEDGHLGSGHSFIHLPT